MINKSIGIIGHFNFTGNSLDGQTVKTKNLADSLKKYTDVEVISLDTYGWKQNPIKLFFNIYVLFKQCDVVIMLPAHNGIKVFAPLLYYLNKVFHKKIFYDVIGGWLPEFLDEKIWLKKYLKCFDGIWVETLTMQKTLEKQGFTNINVVPNFKELNILSTKELVYNDKYSLKLCTFSRVMKEKGIEDAITVVKQVNEELGFEALRLDIYGQVDVSYKDRFEEICENLPSYIVYKGCVDSSKSVEVLKDYFVLLFPTYYQGEGFAGTLLDAFSAGVPVIASDWRYNSEIVNENVGFIYQAKNNDELLGILKSIIDNIDLIFNKKENCLNEAEKYKPENVIEAVLKYIER